VDLDISLEDLTEKEIWNAYDRMYQNVNLYSVKRGMFIGETLFTVSDAYVKATSLLDYSNVGSLDLPGFKEINKYYFEPMPPVKDDDLSQPGGEDSSQPGQTEPGYKGDSGSGTVANTP
jgi:hypothetical protein